MKAVIALAAYETYWYTPPGSLARRPDGWPETGAVLEIERLHHNGLITTNGNQGLLAKRGAVELFVRAYQPLGET